MERKRFEQVVNDLIEKELELLGWKRTEYTSTTDVLQNFKQNAAFLGMTPEQIALVYLTKHYQSIVIAVQTGNFNWVWETANGSEGLKQRFADMVNYAHLLAAIIDEHESPTEGEVQIAEGFTCTQKELIAHPENFDTQDGISIASRLMKEDSK